MDLSGQLLMDTRTVSVGPNSTVIAGVNVKRVRLTIYPISTIPVYINPSGPAVAGRGAVIVSPGAAITYGDGSTPGIADAGVNGCTAGGTTMVQVVDEFLG